MKASPSGVEHAILEFPFVRRVLVYPVGVHSVVIIVECNTEVTRYVRECVDNASWGATPCGVDRHIIYTLPDELADRAFPL